MADPMTSDDAFELKSVMQQILAQMKDSAEGTIGASDSYSRRTSELIAHEELSRRATAAATTATNNNTASMKSLASTMASFGQKLEKLGSSLNKTQNDFGISLASAAKLQVAALKESINSFVKLFTSIDYSQLFSEVGEVASVMGDMATNVAKDFASGKGVANAFTEGGKKIGEVLTKERPGPPPTQFASQPQIIEATKKFQEQFGVINTEFGAQIAQEAKDRGLSVDQLVDARRIFATTAMGDLNKVASIQNKFFDQFQSKGMTPKIALEAITKYADLIARNGNRFADSFARAAADAKKIGVDLSKVDQIGDSIISDFEGFLEKSAELGAMGFNLDTNTLAQLAESGDTGALFNELRSQLAATGKDITKLRRSEQLALSGAFGISMSDIQRLAGGTPQANSMEDYAEEGNSLLGKILALLIAGGPIFSMLSSAFSGLSTLLGAGGDIVKWLTSAWGMLTAVFSVLSKGLLIGGIGLATLFVTKYGLDLIEKGKALVTEGKTKEGVLTGAAGGAAIGTVTMAGLISGLLLMGGGLTSTGIGGIGGIPMIAAALGLSALTGAGVGGSIAYSEGKQDKYGPTIEANKKRQAEETAAADAAKRKEMESQGFRTYIDKSTASVRADTDLLGRLIQQPKSILDATNPNSPYYKPPIKKAEGGLVTGPGTATSDSIPARLSNGEFVVNATSTAKIGADVLTDLNKTGAAGIIKKPLGALKNLELIKMLADGESRKFTETVIKERLKGQIKKQLVNLAGGSALMGTGAMMTAEEVYDTYKKQSKMPHNKNKSALFYTGTEDGKISDAVRHARQRNYKDTALTRGIKNSMGQRYHNGGIAGGASDELPAILQRGEAVISRLQMGGLNKIISGMNSLSAFGDKFTTGATGLKDKVSGMFGGNAGKAVAKAQELKAGGTEGLLSMAQNKFGGMFGGNAGKAMSSVSKLFTGGGSTSSNLMGMATKIPGIGGLLGKATGLLSGGGLKGIAGSLLGKVGLGSLGGSLLGGPMGLAASLAAPLLKKIPLVGGALASIAGGPGKLMSSALGKVGGLLGSKKGKSVVSSIAGGPMGLAAPLLKKIPFVGGALASMAGARGKLMGSALGKIGGLLGKKKGGMDLAGMLPPQMQAMLSGGQPGMEGVNFPAMLAQMMGGKQTQQAPAAPVVVDTKGMEEKLNNFITALQGIQINMDGTKVGKLLVNINDAASAVGVFGSQSR